MKNKWKTALKTAAGLLAALAILNAFCCWYYNPAGYEWDENRATDFVRESNKFVSRAKEGFAWSTTDANGYNNATVPGDDGVYVLMMGSSHTEGMYVMQDETTSSLLADRLQANGVDGFVYNIGASAHSLTRNAANFRRALETFRPEGYVVLETAGVMFSKTGIEYAMSDSFERFAKTEPFIHDWVSDQPLLKTLYRQFEVLAGGAEDEEAAEQIVISGELLQEYEAALTRLFAWMKADADEFGVQMIIYFHPHLIIQEDGSAATDADPLCLQAFSNACAAADVPFIDLSETFLDAYAAEKTLPHGFSNTAPGTSHMNADGNALVADVLCEQILKLEAEK